MRIFLAKFLLFLLFFFSLQAANSQSFINIDRLVRIGLVSNGQQKSFKLEPSNGFIEIFDNRRKQALYSGKASSVTVSVQKKSFFKIEIDGKKNFLNLQGEFLFSPVGKPPNFIELKPAGRKSRSYRGSIAIKSEGTRLFAINQIDIEDYLKSVVPSEIFNRAPAPALEAQAIAARTYAVRNIDRHKKKSDYHLCDTVHCQAYTGMVRELKATSAAVKNTEGKILSYNNEPVNAVYHSNCGGILISSSAAWGGKTVPYLVSHLDGIKGQPTFCSIGKTLKKSKKGQTIKMPKPAKKLIVRSYPAKTRKKLHSNFGHRVGMCQDGAIGMGAIGYSYRQILGFYYPGTRLVTLNYARPTTRPGKKPSKTPVEEPRKEKKQLPMVLAMKPDSTPNVRLEYPVNPTQIDAIKISGKSSKAPAHNSVLGTLKAISNKGDRQKTSLKKVFWNPSQPDIFKDTSTN
jgi:peptidoglycan hydrolase-like amidase